MYVLCVYSYVCTDTADNVHADFTMLCTCQCGGGGDNYACTYVGDGPIPQNNYNMSLQNQPLHPQLITDSICGCFYSYNFFFVISNECKCNRLQFGVRIGSIVRLANKSCVTL